MKYAVPLHLIFLLSICCPARASELVCRQEALADGERLTYLQDGATVSVIIVGSNGEERERTGSIPDGRFKHVNSDGRLLAETAYVSGERHGTVTRYDESGRIDFEGSYARGLLEGAAREYFPGGKILALWTFRQGQLHGVSKEFYETEQLERSSEYAGGLRHGWTRRYWPNGRLQSERAYVKGQLDGASREFGEDGQLLAEVSYRGGRQSGAAKIYEGRGRFRQVKEYQGRAPSAEHGR